MIARLLLALSLATAPVAALALDASADHGFSIFEKEGKIRFSYFDYRENMLQWFESRDLQGGGETWQALVQAAFELDPSPLAADIQYDSEADTFYAVVKSAAASDALKSRINRLVDDEKFREKCVKKAEEGGYLE